MLTSACLSVPNACLFAGQAPRLRWREQVARSPGLLQIAAYLAVDRPDRLEWTAEDSGDVFEGVGGDLPRCGDSISLIDGSGTPCMDARVERIVRRESSSSAPEFSLVAVAPYDRERRDRRPLVWFEERLDAIARAIAAHLGLEARVDACARRYRDLEIVGDPLSWLREVARENRLGLGVAGGTLHLRRELESPSRSWLFDREVGPSTLRMRELEVTELEEGERRGVCTQALASPVRPLDGLRLRGWGKGRDGDYRVLRVLLDHESGAWQSRIEFALEAEAAVLLASPDDDGGFR